MNNENIENILGNINFEVETENEWVEPLGLDKDTWKQILNYITNLQQEKDRLLNIAKKMHTWIFLHTGNEKEVYDELGLTDEENALLGYGGQYIFKKKEVENEKI